MDYWGLWKAVLPRLTSIFGILQKRYPFFRCKQLFLNDHGYENSLSILDEILVKIVFSTLGIDKPAIHRIGLRRKLQNAGACVSLAELKVGAIDIDSFISSRYGNFSATVCQRIGRSIYTGNKVYV